MNKIERIKAAIAKEKVDIYPFSFWTHLPHCDLDPVLLAENTYQFYKDYDIDLIKTMNNGMYSCQDYGCEIDYSEVEKGGVAKIAATPIKSKSDFGYIGKLEIENSTAIKRELYSLELLLEKLKGENVPVIFTVFSPFTTLNKLSDNKLLAYLSQGDTADIEKALENITYTTKQIVKAANSMGASGIYFATQLANYSLCSEEVYRKYAAKYDIEVLSQSDGFADSLHCHGNNIMFDLLKEYPVDIFNWHVYESEPTLQYAKEHLDQCIMTGIVREDITKGNIANIDQCIDYATDLFKAKGHIFSAGCVVRYPLNREVLKHISQKIRTIEL
ncbi:MAG: uroporphyrinogen decarboxylase family protein [Erysipelotrichaceae bacterium]